MISKKDKFILKNTLIELVQNPTSAITYAKDATDLDFSDITIADISSTWSKIIDKLIGNSSKSKNYLLEFLEFFRSNVNNHNDEINRIYLEINKGLNDKINFLLKALENNQLNLCIGQDFLTFKNKSLIAEFSKQLIDTLDKYKIFHDSSQSENVFYLGQRLKKKVNFIEGETGRLLKEFLKNSKSHINKRDFEILGNLPFKSINNFNYDDYLHEFFPEKYDRYVVPEFTQFNTEIKKSTKIKVFNFLGNLNYSNGSESYCILSENELIDFISKTIIEADKNVILNEMQKQFDRKSYCLFLGFDFSNWYIKLLLSVILKINDLKKENYSFHYHDNQLEDYIKDIMEDSFNIVFIDKENQSDFLELFIDTYNNRL